MTKEKYINPYTDFGFKKLFEQAEIARYSDDERWQYEESKKVFWDNYSVMETAHEKGIHEGKEIGRSEANYENAIKMKRRGIESGLISQVTGLTAEEIGKL